MRSLARSMAFAVSLAAVLLWSASCSRDPLSPPGPALSKDLEGELAAIRSAPSNTIGWGGKTTLPYVLRLGDHLTLGGPKGVTRLLAEAMDRRLPRAARLAMVHVLGYSTDPSVDGALIQALTDETLRPLAAYLLGRGNRWGYPERRRDRRAILIALAPHLEDAAVFEDPWYPATHPIVGDLALAAFIAVADPSRFASLGGSATIGLGIDHFDAQRRAELLAACRAIDIKSLAMQEAGEPCVDGRRNPTKSDRSSRCRAAA